MNVTKQTVAAQIGAYLRHDMTQAQLVAWAESMMMEGEFAPAEAPVLSGVVARLGVADVRAFGLSWEDCEEFLHDLGYAAKVKLVPA